MHSVAMESTQRTVVILSHTLLSGYVKLSALTHPTASTDSHACRVSLAPGHHPIEALSLNETNRHAGVDDGATTRVLL